MSSTTGEISNVPYENNVYLLKDFHEDVPSQQIQFYKLNLDGTHEDGTTLGEMLRVCHERLSDLNSRFGCEENQKALESIAEARKWLEKRTEDRKARGVEGKHEV